MRVPVSWLRAHCDPGLTAPEIGERLDLTGTELERIEPIGVGELASFVVGKVVSAEQHPDADRLKVCEVDDGSGEPRTIVCGAPNVEAGQTVAVALPGAVMPDGTKLGKAKLRGIESSGMILAEDEVGIGGDHHGIMVLDASLAAGAPLAGSLPIADEVLELEITPNRPDCLCVYGIAREVHAATGAKLADDPASGDVEPSGDDTATDHVSIEIADPDICLRFTGRVFEDVQIGPSPAWLKQRLTAAGQRPISNVVDITNYVMLECGQPLHAFDLDEVRGGKIVVRHAQPGEKMTTLDDVERTLDPEMGVVCDAEGPSGIAGVMGGQISEISDKTTRVLMEAATWVGPNILKTSKALGLRSEASTRFEKQLHPDNAIAAQRLAARLMVELCGARLVEGTIDVYPDPAHPRTIVLRLERLESILGTRVPANDVQRILKSLGFANTLREERVTATVPYWRDADVQREADLIEEIARVYGLDRLPTTLPARKQAVGRLSREQRMRRRLEDAMRDRGLSEVVAWSFTSRAALQGLRIGGEPVLELANPLSEDQSVMRPLLLPGLLDAAQHNAAHGRGDVALFESAHVYRGDSHSLEAPEGSPAGETPANERHHLGALVTTGMPATWRSDAAPADFFAAKGVLEGLIAATGLALEVEPARRPFLHPGRSADVVVGGDTVGWIGELHPLVAAHWDLDGGAAFEVDAEQLVPEGHVVYDDVTTYPGVFQDLAVIVPADTPAAAVERIVSVAGGELLVATQVFDVYEGEQVGAGNRSLALRLEFRAPDRTLTDEEVNKRRAAIEKELADSIGGRLRG